MRSSLARSPARAVTVRAFAVSAALAIAAVAFATSRPAHACGPDFPVALLHDRAATLGELPEGVFLTEVAYLVEPRHIYPYVAGDGPVPDDAGTRERALYEAREYAAVLALPAAQRRHRSVRAAYMLGREGEGQAAIAAYRRVRALVDDGVEDGAGLALSSLGQEARLHLRTGDVVTAVRLYAEQAALGHPDAGPSLLFVVRDLVEREAERPLLADAVGQRLVATYLATRGLELDQPTADRLWRELAAIDGVAGADQLAAAAYQRGEWARAAAFARHAGDAPMAQWVAAKLALRDGDAAAADRLLARAADGFRARSACPEGATIAPWTSITPTAREDLASPDDTGDTGDTGDPTYEDWTALVARLQCTRERDRVVGDRVAIAVGDGRMADALRLAWEVRELHPDDVDHVAERLVTIPELIAFVDTLPGAGAPAVDHQAWTITPASLRALLGRRLMRAGRHAEALPYLGPSARAFAATFAIAMTRATAELDPIERARALYEASRVAREHGLEILGTAAAPDWEYYGAQYDRFAWETQGPLEVAARGLPELARTAESAPAHAQRYHYRYVAADLAERAADLLPRTSQAFPATLCWAAHYIRRVDAARTQDLYWRALRQGPYIEDMDFPEACPAPDFDAAHHAPPARPRVKHARAHRHGFLAHRPIVRRWILRGLTATGALIATGLLVLVALRSRRRWRRFAPRP